jgi:hypothetical protein
MKRAQALFLAVMSGSLDEAKTCYDEMHSLWWYWLLLVPEARLCGGMPYVPEP